jgi:hypothetical protein
MRRLCLGLLTVMMGCTRLTSEKGGSADTADSLPNGDTDSADSGDTSLGLEPTGAPVVHVVLFTHIEDNAPVGDLDTPQNRAAYLRLRSELLAVAAKASARGLTFVIQPDWKVLEAALRYENAEVMADTGGVNAWVYLRDTLGCTVDPHSHENGGYNYTDVAALLDRLGVGGSTVIGGHIWDPSLPQFQHWDRFRTAQKGERYPDATWRGDILIGAGTPNHVNDPLVSGVWRPKDADHFFEDDPAGNIVAVGMWDGEVAGVSQLASAYADGTVSPTTWLTAGWNIQPSAYAGPTGADDVDVATFAPLAAMQAEGTVVVEDFQATVASWQAAGGHAGTYAP